MQAVGELAQLVERRFELAAQPIELGGGDDLAVVHPLREQPELEPDRHQPLLRAVVEIALYSSSLCPSGRRHAALRGLQLVHQRLQLALSQRSFLRAAARLAGDGSKARAVDGGSN